MTIGEKIIASGVEGLAGYIRVQGLKFHLQGNFCPPNRKCTEKDDITCHDCWLAYLNETEDGE